MQFSVGYCSLLQLGYQKSKEEHVLKKGSSRELALDLRSDASVQVSSDDVIPCS
jgi:hypothetical protein